ncbi:TPA: hypothetical protein ACOEHG_004842 [Enterobacter ludwigii]
MTTEQKKQKYGTHFPFLVLMQAIYRPAFTVRSFAEVAGVTRSTVDGWERMHPEFRQAMNDGKTLSLLMCRTAQGVSDVVLSVCELPSFRALSREERISLLDGMLHVLRHTIIRELQPLPEMLGGPDDALTPGEQRITN